MRTLVLADASRRLALSDAGHVLAMADASRALVLADTELRALPWRNSWKWDDVTADPTYWQQLGKMGGRVLGESSYGPQYGFRRLTGHLSAFSDQGGGFDLQFGPEELGPAPAPDAPPFPFFTAVRSGAYVVSGAALFSMAGDPLATIAAPTPPTDDQARYWKLAMPSPAALGIAPGTIGVLRLVVRPGTDVYSRLDYFWLDPLTPDAAWVAAGRWDEREAWKAARAAEVAANAAEKPFTMLFMVGAPSA